MDENIKEQSKFYECIKWIEDHQNKETGEYRVPRQIISKAGKKLKVEEMTKEEKKECKLGWWWSQRSKEKKIIEEFQEKSIEEIPEEYREIVMIGRKLGLKKRNIFNEYIEWIEEHKDEKNDEYNYPRCNISKEGKNLQVEDMTKEEIIEYRLGYWWHQRT